MSELSTGILVFFVLAALVSLGVTAVTGKVKPAFQPHQSDWMILGALVLPFAGLLGLGNTFQLGESADILYFTGTVVLCWLLYQLQLPSSIRGTLLLLGAVGVTLPALPEEGTVLILNALLWGLLAWKLAETFYYRSQTDGDDVLPGLTWLLGAYWMVLTGYPLKTALYLGILLGALGISLLLRHVDRLPVKLPERFMAKPLLTAVIGALGLLILITNVLWAPTFGKWACLYGFGIFLGFFLNVVQSLDDQALKPHKVLLVLVGIGLGTLVASRMFGTFGWVVLTGAMLVALRPGMVLAAAAFLLTRTLLQVFIVQHNPNVTGINITHPYTSAALYASILLVFLLPLFYKSSDSPLKHWVTVAGLGLLVPALAMYFFHAEPTGSLLTGTVVSALMVVAAGPLLSAETQNPFRDNLLWWIAFMVSTGLVGSGLIELGNVALRSTRLMVLGAIAVLLLAAWAGIQKFGSGRPSVNVS